METQVVTIFGGSGFIGSYVVQKLAKLGYRIKVVCRSKESAKHLRVFGPTGKVVGIACDITDKKAVIEAVRGSDIVINLIGILYPQNGHGFAAIHAHAAERIAKESANAGVKRFIHVSALGVNHNPQSRYARSKYNGEQAVQAAFPHATVLRPSVVFGREDNFINMFASMARISPVLPLIGGGKTRFQPVYVGDVADAIVMACSRKRMVGMCYELGGPDVMTFKEIVQFILKTMHKKRVLLTVPFGLAKFKAMFLELLPHPMLTRDQVILLKSDNVVSPEMAGFADIDIQPKSMKVIVPDYLAS